MAGFRFIDLAQLQLGDIHRILRALFRYTQIVIYVF
jgi:hypothetical protein